MSELNYSENLTRDVELCPRPLIVTLPMIIACAFIVIFISLVYVINLCTLLALLFVLLLPITYYGSFVLICMSFSSENPTSRNFLVSFAVFQPFSHSNHNFYGWDTLDIIMIMSFKSSTCPNISLHFSIHIFYNINLFLENILLSLTTKVLLLLSFRMSFQFNENHMQVSFSTLTIINQLSHQMQGFHNRSPYLN